MKSTVRSVRNESGHDAPMNYLSRNVKYLQGDGSAYTLARKVGTSQPTVFRIMSQEGYTPGEEVVEKICLAFGLSRDELLNTDLAARGDVRGQPMVRIRMLDGFDAPASGVVRMFNPFPSGIDVSRDWFDFNVGVDPERVRYAVMRDDSMHGEIEKGDIVLVDTSVTDPKVHGEGNYAFDFFDVRQIKRLRVIREGVLQFTGTKPIFDSMTAEGVELEGLRVIGKVVNVISFKRM